MANILGFDFNTPTVDISGFLSSSWVYVFLIAIIGIAFIASLAVMLFIMTYNRKVVIFENISGLGYQPVLKSRARIIRIGKSGVEVLKTLKGKHIVSSYGRKMGKNTYWFGKAQDGYLYNIRLGDLDGKLAMLDIEPVDRDVRMFHAARSKLTENDYGEKRSWVEKYAPSAILLFTVIILMVGFYIVSGKINEGLIASSNPDIAKTNKETAELLNQMASRLDSIQRGSSGQGGSGLVPATEIDTGGG